MAERPQALPRCRACGQVDTLPQWQWGGSVTALRLHDQLQGGLYAQRLPGRASPSARPFYTDREGNAWFTQCAGCVLGARIRDILVTQPPQAELRCALQFAFDQYVRRQIERVPGPPLHEFEEPQPVARQRLPAPPLLGVAPLVVRDPPRT